MKPQLSIPFIFFVFLYAGSFGQNTIILKPDASTGKDAGVGSCIPCGYNNQNYENSKDFCGIAWTNQGEESIARGLIEFNLNAIPFNSTIVKAQLSLYFNPVSSNEGHSSLSGSNSCLLKRITEPWEENSVTWDNQPATTDTNEVVIKESITFYQNYPFIDVTNLVKDMLKYPTRSFGFMLQLVNEHYYRSMLFSSSDHPDTTLHPKLEITYQWGLGYQDFDIYEKIWVYPNPSNGRFTISNIPDAVNTVEITNLVGLKVYQETVKSESKEVNINMVPMGIYFIRITNGTKTVTRKIIKY
jgi:hypothetical protein